MRKPLHPATGFDKIGLTWFIRDKEGVNIVSHGGATNGQIAGLYFVPEKQFALAVLTNSEDGRAITGAALKKALKVYLGIDLVIPKPIETPEEDLREYVGCYELPLLAYELKLKKGQLVVHETPRGGFPKPDSPPLPAAPPMRMAFYEKDKILVLDEPMKNCAGRIPARTGWFTPIFPAFVTRSEENRLAYGNHPLIRSLANYQQTDVRFYPAATYWLDLDRQRQWTVQPGPLLILQYGVCQPTNSGFLPDDPLNRRRNQRYTEQHQGEWGICGKPRNRRIGRGDEPVLYGNHARCQ